MLLKFYIVVAAVCIPCISYLLMTTVEKDEFFLTRNLARWLFPRLDRRERHKKMEFITGILLAVFLTAAVIAFLINRFGRG